MAPGERETSCPSHDTPIKTSPKHSTSTSNSNKFFTHSNRKQQFPSVALFLSAIILITLSPFSWLNLPPEIVGHNEQATNVSSGCCPDFSQISQSTGWPLGSVGSSPELCGGQQSQLGVSSYLDGCVKFLQSMFMNNLNAGRKFNQAEAKVLGKMAKMWYIKKKLKKLGKKLKKHTIAVPVFTTIPIYEPHPYFPQPHIAHVPAPHVVPMHHHHHAAAAAAAASSYSPVVVSQLAAAAAVAAAQQQHQQNQHQHQTNQHYAASASNQQQQVAAYRVPAPAQANHNQQQQQQQQQHQKQQQHQQQPQYHPSLQATNQLHHAIAFHPIPAANQIINTYVPAAPIFVDESGGLYGTYGNAYGRYDGGWQLW